MGIGSLKYKPNNKIMNKHDDIECPYCGEGMEICNDDGHGTDESETYEEECPHCEKSFSFTAYISFSYTARKADCLNGADHDWRKGACAPAGLFLVDRTCNDCGGVDRKFNPDFKH
jgi:hypothetical protein